MPCDALYIHIPFCEHKCPYCDFYSLAANEETMEQYTAALIRAIDCVPFPILPLDTLYFGGGTPSALGGKRIARIVEAARRRFSILPNAEITVECNPHSTLRESLMQMRAAGVNRISLGMQSANDIQLRTLGRLHTVQDVQKAVQTAWDCSFEHISLDMMLGTPGQTSADIDRAAALCAQLGAEHVSAYLLKIEDGTPFARNRVGERCPDENGQAALYLHAIKALASHGYEQYEISNFARHGKIARHNLKYWDCREYLGLGPSAHSLVNGRRFYFERDLAAFMDAENPFAIVVQDGEGGDVQEYLMLRLRLRKGISWEILATRYPDFNTNELREKARRLSGSGLIEFDEHSLCLTEQGFLLSNAVIGELL